MINIQKIKREEKIPLFKVFMSEEAIKNCEQVLRSGYIGQGEKVEEFERKLGEFFGKDSKFCITTNTGTSAEHLLWHTLKVKGMLKRGDTVLTTPLTCTATNFPIIANGFILKWVDIDKKTFNIDLLDLERKIDEHTKAIQIVHWGGYPVDLDGLKLIQLRTVDKFGFCPIIVEDCAHAFGSLYNMELIGNHGNFCTFSFQAIKHLTCGDGGMVSVPMQYKHIIDSLRLLRWYGIDRNQPSEDFRCEANIEDWGFKFHMNDINASIGLGNLIYINEIIKKRRDIAQYYNEELRKINGIFLLENRKGRLSSYWLYTILVDKVDDFRKYMKEKGIIVSRVHERNDKHSCMYEYRSHLPNLNWIVKKMICIPIGHWISEEDKEYIVDCIKQGW